MSSPSRTSGQAKIWGFLALCQNNLGMRSSELTAAIGVNLRLNSISLYSAQDRHLPCLNVHLVAIVHAQNEDINSAGHRLAGLVV